MKNTQKCQKGRFCYFCTQNQSFLNKNGCKAHTKLQQGKTSMNQRFPIKKFTIEIKFYSILQKTYSSGKRGGAFAVFFFSTTRPAREKQFGPSATSALVLLFHQIPSFYNVCSRKRVRNTRFISSISQMAYGASIN